MALIAQLGAIEGFEAALCEASESATGAIYR